MTNRIVGIIGLGIMGGAIARNLVERGWTVVGFDTEPARCSELAQAGVTIVDGTSAVAARASTVITSLPNADAAASVATTRTATSQINGLSALSVFTFWITEGKLRVRIGGEYPLADAARAHADMESRKTTGKLLLVP